MDDRRRGIRLDWTLNVGNIVALVMLALTLMNYGSQVIGYLSNMNNKVNVMWVQFSKDHPETAALYKFKEVE